MQEGRWLQDSFGLIFTVTIRVGSKPGLPSDRRYRLFISSPALSSSTSVSATSPAINQLRRELQRVVVDRWPPVFIELARSMLDALTAGATPNATPVTNASAAANAPTSQSTVACISPGVPAGSSDLKIES